MKDPRFTDLARLLVGHSCNIQSAEKVLIEAFDIPPEFVVELVRAVAAAGGLPLVSTYSQIIQRALYSCASEAQMKLWTDVDKARMEKMDAYMGVRGSHNIAETSDIPRDK